MSKKRKLFLGIIILIVIALIVNVIVNKIYLNNNKHKIDELLFNVVDYYEVFNKFDYGLAGDELLKQKEIDIHNFKQNFFVKDYQQNSIFINAIKRYIQNNGQMSNLKTDIIVINKPHKFLFFKTIKISAMFSMKFDSKNRYVYSVGYDSSENQYNDKGTHSKTEYCRVEFKLIKENDKWKIVDINGCESSNTLNYFEQK